MISFLTVDYQLLNLCEQTRGCLAALIASTKHLYIRISKRLPNYTTYNYILDTKQRAMVL